MLYSALIEEFRRAPFVRLLLPFLLGLVCQTLIVSCPIVAFPIAAGFFVLYLLSYFCIKSYALRWVHGISLYLLLFFCGVSAVQNTQQQSELPQNVPLKILAVVADHPAEGLKFIKFNLQVKGWQDTAGNAQVAHENIFVYLRKQDGVTLPKLGDELMLSAVLQAIPPPQNPYEFDYAEYLQTEQIFCSAFVDIDKFVVVDSGQLSWFPMFIKTLSRRALQVLDNTGIDGDELAVLHLLTLGDRTLIDSDLRNSYAVAGASHVLSVSGAHVVMIAMILSYLLVPFKRKKYGEVFSGAALLLILWTYAFITGLAPPVLRATIMYTLMTANSMLARKGNTYNNLAFAALLICVFDPYALFDVGFQLSFMAVISIAFFHPRIHRLLYINNKILDAVWGATVMSVAANIGTFPIVLYIFHQFPLYFILTNVLISLPVTLILVFFVGVFLLSFVPVVNAAVPFLAIVLNGLVWLLNFVVRMVESIPGSLVEGLWITASQTWMLMLFLLLFSLLLWTRLRALVVGALLCLTLFFATRASVLYHQQQQRLAVVYSVRNTSLIMFYNARHPFVVCDSSDMNNSFDFQTKSHLASLGVNKLNDIPKLALQELPRINDEEYAIYRSHIDYYGKTIAILAAQAPAKPQQALPVEILIITSQCRWTPQQVFAAYQPQEVVLDASLPRAMHQKFINYLTQHNLQFHSVQQSGAYVKRF